MCFSHSDSEPSGKEHFATACWDRYKEIQLSYAGRDRVQFRGLYVLIVFFTD